MENQEKQFNSLEYFHDKVEDLIVFDEQMKMIEEAKKRYDEEIEKAYRKGWDDTAIQFHNY
jgi:transcription termination factor NusB